MNAATAAADAQSSRIEINGVGKRYGDLQVFKDINLEFREREIVTIVGPSGCGKTTLLRCIDGLLPVNEGEIRIEGDLITQPREGVSMVFQHFGLFPWKTVRHNVGYGLKLAGAPRAEIAEKVPYYTDLVGLKGFEDAYPYQLSGGMQQRCGLARALTMEPSVLLMDEPFAAVDAQTREILQFELLKIWGMRPMTMVFVTHSIEEAVLMGDRVVVLKGRPSSVFEVIDVDLPAPRDRSTLSHPRFAEYREHVWNTLMDEVRAAEFELN
ncbi:MAG: ABC transporter ATP-binding protein [Rhodospirillaceae bacterium]|jgi:NitT/TauT family transport system ATP-binding protein|nr:ABC transporter ATP-binding protein [Rhodospirillaceae bacterium]MBT3931979.1 ABC transporter ATP-binding protein [Rhodospirillaceae bacterium]MBT4771088.1 ABC transporter ATP-binding protein [Rhodospirillaceae bacterium]MBT5357713.1 ABC transporter ATP-binding protein [Rhodospirillaceae bacterium]MBT5768855.1 ABC transporter ATP-binding protein [Rhodospirillaceae bacterium]